MHGEVYGKGKGVKVKVNGIVFFPPISSFSSFPEGNVMCITLLDGYALSCLHSRLRFSILVVGVILRSTLAPQ